MGLGFGIEIGDWGLGLKIVIRNWEMEIGIGDFVLEIGNLELRFGSADC